MKIVLLCHAFTSCWNNGHAHFLRGIAREFVRLGHHMVVVEALDGWSRSNALLDGGTAALEEAEALVPGIELLRFRSKQIEAELDWILDDADIVLVHEWNEPALVAAIGRKRRHSSFLLFFVDAHHRAISAPDQIDALELEHYDGVLAFGESLREVYARRGWGRRAFTWHEAADITLFRPLPEIEKTTDLIWVGNWGDEERSRELREYLIDPVLALQLKARIHGVRYPNHALRLLDIAGITFGGWLPNHRVPQAFASARVTVHVPRNAYAGHLPGIPTIRVFEALACGIPLVCAPWSDEEGLFPEGAYLKAASREAMISALEAVLADPEMAQAHARRGLDAIAARHTCRHRVNELLAIAATLAPPRVAASPALSPACEVAP